MDNQNTPESNNNLVLVYFLVASLVGAGIFITSLQQKQSQLTDTNLQLQQQLLATTQKLAVKDSVTPSITPTEPTPSSSIPVEVASPTQTSTIEKESLTLLSPKAGQNLCLGQNFQIQWEAPIDMGATTIMVRKFNDNPINTYTVEIVPASLKITKGQKVGIGTYTWNVGQVSSRYGSTETPKPLQAGPAYQIIVKGVTSDNQAVGDWNTEPFTISNCAQ